MNTILLMISFRKKNPKQIIQNFYDDLIINNQVGNLELYDLLSKYINIFGKITISKKEALNLFEKHLTLEYNMVQERISNDIYKDKIYSIFQKGTKKLITEKDLSRFKSELSNKIKTYSELQKNKTKKDGNLKNKKNVGLPEEIPYIGIIDFLMLFNEKEYLEKLINLSIYKKYLDILNNLYSNLSMKFILEGNLSKNIALLNFENDIRINEWFEYDIYNDIKKSD